MKQGSMMLLPRRGKARQGNNHCYSGMQDTNIQGQQHALDVHHGVRVLAGMGLGSTAGARCNGHTMLPAGQVAPNWDVQGGVGVKEPKRLQKEAHMLSWHDWPILYPGNVGHSKRVPDDAVSFLQVPVLHSQPNI